MNTDEVKRRRDERHEIYSKPLTDEEYESRKNCVSNMFWKVSIPFAIVTQFFTFKNTGEVDRPPSTIYWRRGIGFLANILVTSLVFARVCDYQVIYKRAELKKRERAKEGVPLQRSEDAQPSSQPDDFSYPSDAITNLSEPEGSYSTDLTSTKLDLEDETNINVPRTTTYEDLRARNRSKKQSHGNKNVPASTLNFDSETTPRKHSSPPEEPISTDQSSHAKGPRKLNKYGDEIE